jgi:hypothetical protein
MHLYGLRPWLLGRFIDPTQKPSSKIKTQT